MSKISKCLINDTGRVCTVCGKFKLWEEFNKQCSGINGYCSSCKYCFNNKRLQKKIKSGENVRVACKMDSNGKVCSKCRQYKTWDKFYKTTKHSTGYTSNCIDCLKQSNKEKHKKIEKFIANTKGRECIRCGKFNVWEKYLVNPNRKSGHNSLCDVCRHKEEAKRRLMLGHKVQKVYMINDDGRVCCSCGVFKKWEEYTKSKYGTRGYKSYCKKCDIIKNAPWKEKNKEKLKKQRIENRIKHKDEINMIEKLKRKENPQHRLRKNLRSRLYSVLKAQKTGKASNTFKLIGCSVEELVHYLEKTSSEGYAVIDIALKGIHVDHIIPCSYFDLTNPIEQAMCFNYRNLQLLKWDENIKKGNKLPRPEGLKNKIMCLALAVIEEKPFEI